MSMAAYAENREWIGLALALALGLLVGLQRGWAHRTDAPGTRFAGIRTFGLIGLAGGISGALFTAARPVAVIIVGASAGLILLSYYRASRQSDGASGTTSIVGLITLACGFLAATDHWLTAIAIAVPMMLLLAMRRQLHRMERGLSEAEVAAIARFALIALVILPLLPDAQYGPFDAWNPRQLWLVVVFVSGFSLMGYLAGRLLGDRLGTIATAATGSLVSSTAVTASLANGLKQESAVPALLFAGVCVASAVMFLRVMLLVAVIAPFALPTLAALALPGVIVSFAAAALFYRRMRQQPPGAAKRASVKNPFAIGPALLLLALVMVMTVAARWALERFGDAELVVVLAISGTVDVDSAVIAMGSLPREALEPRMAGLSLLAPIVLNTLFKAGAMVSIAGWRRSRPAFLALLLSALASLGALPFVL